MYFASFVSLGLVPLSNSIGYERRASMTGTSSHFIGGEGFIPLIILVMYWFLLRKNHQEIIENRSYKILNFLIFFSTIFIDVLIYLK